MRQRFYGAAGSPLRVLGCGAVRRMRVLWTWLGCEGEGEWKKIHFETRNE